MKKLSGLLILLFCAVFSFSQSLPTVSAFPNNQTISNNSTLYHAKGGLIGDSGLVVISFPDTTTANYGSYIKGTNGLLIKVHDTLFIRDVSQSKWIKFISGSTTVINFPGIDSTTYINNIICFYSGGLPTCYPLGRFYDSVSLNHDSTYLKFWNNGNFMDSIWLPHDNVYAVPPLFINRYPSSFNLGDSVVFSIDTTGFSTGGIVITDTTDWAVDTISNSPNFASITGYKVLVGTSPTGVFVGNNNKIATYDSTTLSYTFQSATIGDLLYDVSTGYVYKLTGGGWVQYGRLVLIQNGNKLGIGIPIVMGSIDSANVAFKLVNQTAAYFDRSDKYLKLVGGGGLGINATVGSPAPKIYWGDPLISIYSDGASYMIHDAYSGRWRFRRSGAGFLTQVHFTESDNAFLFPTTFGVIQQPNASAMIDMISTTKGLLIPRMTAAQRLAIGGDIATANRVNGSGYTNGSYSNIPLSGGTGINAAANMVVSGGAVTSFTFTNFGRGYKVNDVLSATTIGAGTGFTITITSLGIKGLLVTDTDSSSTFQFTGSEWQNLYNLSGGGSTYTGSNGITLSTNDFQLGGPILHNTNINQSAGDYAITLQGGASNTSSMFNVQDGERGILGSGSIIGINAASSNIPLLIGANNNTTNSIQTGIVMQRSTFAGAIGNGISIETELNNDVSIGVSGSVVQTKLTSVTSGSEVSQYEILLNNLGSTGRKLALAGTGQMTLDGYTSSGFRVTDSTNYKPLVVNSSGIISQSYWFGGSGGGSDTNIGNSDLTVTGNRILNLAGNTFDIKQSTASYLHLDPVNNTTIIKSVDPSDDAETGLSLLSNPDNANFVYTARLYANDTGSGRVPQLLLNADAINGAYTFNLGVTNFGVDVFGISGEAVTGKLFFKDNSLSTASNGYVLGLANQTTGEVGWIPASAGVASVTGDLVDNTDPLNPVVGLTGTHTLTGVGTVDVNGNNLQFISGAGNYIQLLPTAGSESIRFRVTDPTADGNLAEETFQATPTLSRAIVRSVFNDGVKSSKITVDATATDAAIAYEADTHTFAGAIINNADTSTAPFNVVTIDGNNQLRRAAYPSSGVTSVSGTTNRITSTGGATPVIDISSTFENLLLKKSDSISPIIGYTSRYQSNKTKDSLQANIQKNTDSISAHNIRIGANTVAIAGKQNTIGSIQTYVVYVDTLGNDGTGQVGNITKPYLTISAAIAALPDSGIVMIGYGSFTSPTSAQLKSHITLQGVKKPTYNWTVTATSDTVTTYTAPTRLLYGTILKGSLQFIDKTDVKIYNLGVDVGSAFVAAGGTEGNGISVGASTTGSGLTPPYAISSGVEVKNVIVLCKNATSAFHALVIESTLNPVLENITTCYGTHGISFKSVGGIINNVECYSHGSDAITIKYDPYSIAGKIVLSNFIIGSVTGKEGGGVYILAGSGNAIKDIAITNGVINYTSFGIKAASAYNVSVSNVIASYTSGIGFEFQQSQVSLIGCISHHNVGVGFYMYLSGANTSTNSYISECYSYANQSHGIDANAFTLSRLYISNSTFNFNTGYGIKVTSSGNVFATGYNTTDSNTVGTVNGTFNYLTAPNGNLGIGVTGLIPTFQLQVEKSASGAIGPQLALINPVTNAVNNKVRLLLGPSASVGARYAAIDGINEDGGANIGIGITTGSGATITEKVRFDATGHTGFGVSASLSGIVHIKAGTATAGTSPIKLTLLSAVINTAAERGAIEAASNRLYYTDSTATRYILHAGGTPTIAAGTGAGGSPTISITGIDEDGYVTLTTGTLPTLSGTVGTITFSSAYGAAPKCVILSPANSNAASLSGLTMVFVDQAGISTTTWAITAGATALTAATVYKWFYRTMQ